MEGFTHKRDHRFTIWKDHSGERIWRAGGGRQASMEAAAMTHIVFKPSPVIYAHFIDEKIKTKEGQSVAQSHIACQGHS